MGYLCACFLLWIFTLHSNILPIIIALFVWRQHCASSLLCHNQGFWVTCNLHMLSLRLGLSVCSFDSVTHRTNVQFCWIFNCLMLFLQVMFQVWCLQTMTDLSLVNHTPTFFHKFSNFLFYIPVSDLNLVIVWASSMYLILLWLWQNPWGESRSRTEVRFWLTIIKTSFHSWVTFEPVEWQYILALGACAKKGYPLMAPKKYREQERRRLTSRYPLQGHASNDLTFFWNQSGDEAFSIHDIRAPLQWPRTSQLAIGSRSLCFTTLFIDSSVCCNEFRSF